MKVALPHSRVRISSAIYLSRISAKRGDELIRQNMELTKANEELVTENTNFRTTATDLEARLAAAQEEVQSSHESEARLYQKLDYFQFCCCAIVRAYKENGDVQAMVNQLEELRQRWIRGHHDPEPELGGEP